MLRVLDLFSGIGGFSLGLERTGGFKTVAFCEIDPFCRRVLAKHWPGVKCYEDVRTLDAPTLQRDGIAVDVITGGFPCQDISVVGLGAGLDGNRSGLWSELCRLIGEIRPRYAIVENVAALLTGPPERPGAWFGRVLGDLAEIRFDVEWHSIPAAAVDAPHERDRVFLVAQPQGHGRGTWRPRRPAASRPRKPITFGPLSYSDANSIAPIGTAISRQKLSAWDDEPALDRVVDGLPYRLVEEELRALGNAVVPSVASLIGMGLKAASWEAESDG